jgi:hypothetical protein
MAGERGEFAGKGGLVKGEHDDGQIALVAETVEQRLQREHIVGRGRDIAALVPAEGVEDRWIVIAHRSWMDLHDEPAITRPNDSKPSCANGGIHAWHLDEGVPRRLPQ